MVGSCCPQFPLCVCGGSRWGGGGDWWEPQPDGVEDQNNELHRAAAGRAAVSQWDQQDWKRFTSELRMWRELGELSLQCFYVGMMFSVFAPTQPEPLVSEWTVLLSHSTVTVANEVQVCLEVTSMLLGSNISADISACSMSSSNISAVLLCSYWSRVFFQVWSWCYKSIGLYYQSTWLIVQSRCVRQVATYKVNSAEVPRLQFLYWPLEARESQSHSLPCESVLISSCMMTEDGMNLYITHILKFYRGCEVMI